MKNRFQHILPHIYVIIAFFVLTFLYFSPLIEGKVISQTDNIQVKGMAAELTHYKQLEGEAPLWTNNMFGGMPAYQIWAEYPSNFASYFIRFWNSIFPNPANILLLYLLGAYLLFCTLRFKPMLAAVGAIAIAFVSYNFIIIEAGHTTKAYAIAYFAPIIAGILLTLRGRYLTGATLAAVFLALEIRANHIQMTYYLMLVVLVMIIAFIVDAVKNKRFAKLIKPGFALLGAAILAVGVNFGSLWVNYEYAKDTIRGKSELSQNVTGHEATDGLDKEYAYQWSEGMGEISTFLVPNAYGGASSIHPGKDSKLYETLVKNNVPPVQAQNFAERYPTYWGDKPFTSGPYYFGIVVFFFFVLGLFIVKGPKKWWLLAATVLVILLSFGRHLQWFSDLFFDYFPYYNKFRAVESILALAGLTIPLLALLAIKKLVNEQEGKKELEKHLKTTVYIVGGLLLLLLAVPGVFFDFRASIDSQQFSQIPFGAKLQEAIQSDRQSMLRMDALRSLVFMLIAAGTTWAIIKQKLKPQTAIIIIGLALLVDAWSVNKRYLNGENFVAKSRVSQHHTPRPVDLQIMQDSSYYRVYDATIPTFNSSFASYFHNTIGGYHAAKLRRYQELIEHHIQKGNMKVLNMLNTKYFIVPDSTGQQIMVRPNADALGNAWFVNGVQFVPNADAELEALNVFVPRSNAIVDERFRDMIDISKIMLPDTMDAHIELTSYHPEHLTYKYTSGSSHIAVFSEIYYNKGWKAYLDGKEHPYFRTDYVLRGMQLPAGEHTVEFKFHPKAYYVGEKISLASSILLVLLLLGSIYWEAKRRF